MKILVTVLISVLCFEQISAAATSADGSTIPPEVGGLGEHGMSPPPNITVGDAKEVAAADHAEVLKHLDACLPRLSTGAAGKMELVKVTKITKQVVSGFMYDIEGDFKVGDKEMHCEVWVWYKGWLEKDEEKYQIKGSCNDQTATWRPANDKGDW